MKRVVVNQKAVWVQKEGGSLWVHLNGETWELKSERASGVSQRQSGVKATSSGQVKAPMPGKITKVFLNIGATVAPGDPLVVMEAMKMEYTLKAEISGSLTKLECKVGDQVKLGQLLCSVENSERLS